MSEFNLDSIIQLLEHANQQGINVSLAGEELSVKFQKGSAINKDLLEELKLNKPHLLHYFNNYAAKTSQPGLLKIQRSERDGLNGLPVSFAQERLWFIDQLEGSVQYHIPSVLHLKGKLNIDALNYAIRQIVDRHEVLRTVLREHEGKAWQYIRKENDWQLTLADGAAYRDNNALLQQEIQQLINQPFDLSKDYMIRGHLLSIHPELHVLVVTLHHIASDGWSASIIVRELVELYEAFESNREPNLLPLEIQYADYATWQRHYLQGETLDKKLAYWKDKLNNITTLELPLDFERPAIQSNRGAATSFFIEKDLTDQLQQLSKQQEATLFMTMLAAFNVLLYRYTGQADICVGTPIAGRDQQEVEALIGFFINSLALRNDLSGNPSFTELLRRVKTTTLEAYENKELPFEKVVDAIVKERNLSRSPVFQVMFALQNMPAIPQFRLGDIVMTTGEFENDTSKFDLAVFITETGNGMQVSLRYCTDLFKETTIRQLLGHFKNLLEAIVQSPQQRIGLLKMLDQQEQQQLQQFNQRSSVYPADKTIIELFEQQVAETPAAIALTFGEQQLTYAGLNEKANQLGHYLQSAGVLPGALVAISIERSVEMMVGILAILKAGAAYVPLDPEYPSDRVQFMLEDTATSLILTSTAVQSKLPTHEGVRVLCLDEIIAELAEQPVANLQVDQQPTDLAYIIYTSGSMGTPKGVMVMQKNVVSLVKEVDYVAFDVKDKLLSTGSSSFDATTFEYWGMLLNGGQLVLCTEERLMDHELLQQEINDRGITKMWFTSSWFNQLVEADITLFKNLRTILVGGEKLSDHHIEKFRQTYPAIVLINGYGPTENTTFSCTYHIEETRLDKPVPIGRPLNNRGVLILDENDQMVPVGVSGEIYLYGDGLSAGYLNRPELTAEKFVANIYSPVAGSQMYKTGDIGCWLANGNVAYKGRKDEQVKIRGYRIELGEIEACLLQSNLVKQAVVIAREDIPGIKRLVGYIVADQGVDKENISAYLQAKLPAYMVPAIWVQMESLPLTPNGKTDKKALPAPGVNELAGNEYLAPQNETEANLAAIWKELLHAERVGIHDNFFELGGDSILTIQVVSRARRLGYELLPKDLFIYQTISRLASAIADRSGATVTGEQGILTGMAALLPIQQWWLDMEQPESHHFNQSVLLGLNKKITLPALSAAVMQLMEQHDALRFRYTKDGNQWLQEYGNEKGEIITADLRDIPAASLNTAIAELATKQQQSLNLTSGKLVRVVWIQTPADETNDRLLIIIHHMAVDGVSWRIILEDLELLLKAAVKNESISLGHKTSSFRQWQQALDSWGSRSGVSNQLNYWREATKNYTPLPVDFEYDGPVKDADLLRQNSRLNAVLTTQLLQEVPKVYHTEINDILLAALAYTLCNWSGSSSLNMGMEGHGREDVSNGVDTSRTVGWFTSLYPLSLVLPARKEDADLIKSVKEQLRQLPGKGLGYGVLKYIRKELSLQGGEPWDIVFNYFGQLDNIVRESDWFSGAGESQGAVRSEQYSVTEKIAISSSVRNGELILNWSFSGKHYDPVTIQQLSADYIVNLQSLITHCLEQFNKNGVVFTPADYGLAGEIGYEELDRFLSEEVDGTERRAQIEGLYRLSGLQEGMLFHGLYDVKIGAYMEQFACELFGVHLETLKKSWAHMITRHSILRSAFYVDALTLPVQCVYRQVELPVEVLDYRGLNNQEQLAAIKEYDTADKNKGFDFKSAPLMRLAIFRLSEDRFRMLWTSHHILFDGWSFPILMEEFLTTYELYSNGGEPAVTEEDKYEDYIRYIERTDKDAEEEYWRNYLAGIEESTLLPFIPTTIDRNKGKGHYKAIGIHLDVPMAAKIQQFAHRHRVTLNTIMQCVWAYLLYRYTGQKNIVYGIIVSGRPDDLSGVEQRVGMYINTLPLHTALDDTMGISEWLQQMQAEQVNSRQYQHTPFPVVQGWSGIPGDLFDTLLTFENYPFSKVITKKQWALNVGNVDMQDHTNYPLSIVIGSSDQMNIRFSYNALLMEDVYVKEIRDHFENVLLQVIEKGDRSIRDIGLLTSTEQEQLLSVFNEKLVDNAGGQTLLSLFAKQVDKTPGATALVFKEEELSFRLLDEQSNQLAHYLRSKGITAESLVPVFINRSMDMMVAIFGILKAGGAYVPIDTDYPQERISYILEDTGATIVLTNSESKGQLPVATGIENISLDTDAVLITAFPATPVSEQVLPGQLAYIIYTSGSTGRPKGVMIEHRNLINYLENEKLHYTDGYTNQSGSFVHLSYTFDASLTAMFMPLLAGKKVVIGSLQSIDIFEDSNLLKHAPYDFIKITPAHLELIHPAFKKFRGGLLTGKLVIGGEAIHSGQFDAFINDGLDVTIINEYGPTEATVGCTTYSFQTIAGNEAIEQSIPIGQPIGQASIYILDHEHRLVPIGVKGEICIGGAGVARGYLNRAGLTAEKFINNTFDTGNKQRIYMTGDIGRWLPDGNIEYLGRVDDQVKIRGYRIELGEVEQVLQQQESVTQGVVLAKADKDGAKRLVGYYVPEASAVKAREYELQLQRVASWKELYEVEYGQTEKDESIDPEFNIIGWNDSFTGEPMPPHEMKLWLDDIVSAVLRDRPSNVLEIGCGTGLIYYQLAGKLDKYIGCDLSLSSINQIREQVSKGLRPYGETELFTAPAHEVNLNEGQRVDTILLNSMVQYFPGEDYMNNVLEKCMQLINGKGRIIIGDVRDNRLLGLFKARLRLQKLQDSIAVKEFKWGIDQDLLKEEELCFSPLYFYRLKEIYPLISHIDIRWKQGDYINELSLYRYTVVIYVGVQKQTITPDWIGWDAAHLQQILAPGANGQLAATIALSGVPNPRLWKEAILQSALLQNNYKTVGEIVPLLESPAGDIAQINKLLRQAEESGYTYQLLVHEDPLKVNLLLEKQPSNDFIINPSAAKIDSGNSDATNIPLFTDISFILQKDIRDLMHLTLPEYMVPGELNALRQLPLTINGKVDRAFLSQREDRVFVNTLNYLPPSTSIEIAVAEIWKELLHLEKVGIEDDFFDLGGHSLLAMRVIAAIRKEMQVELNIKELFIHPTIASLAGHIQQQSKGILLPSIEAVEPRPDKIPLSFSQERLWFIDQLDGSLQYHIPAVLKLSGKLDVAALSAALQTIINRHEVLRTVIQADNGQGYQLVKAKDSWQLTMVDGSMYTAGGEDLQRFIKQQFEQPFNLAADDMLRATLVQLSPAEHILVATLHHIASDGWSTSIMVNELAELYNAFTTGRKPSLPALPIQYADFAIWQRKYLQGEAWDKKLNYWKQKLDAVEPLELSTDFPRSPVQSTRGAITGLKLDKQLSDELQAFSQQQGATLFMTLLATFKVLLYRYTGQADLCVGTPVAGRQHQEVEGLIGFFVNTLALRSQLQPGESFLSLLQQVKTTTLEAYEHQEVPFEKVVEMVTRERDMSRSPLFQVMLVLQNTPEIKEIRLGELELQRWGAGKLLHTTTQFELTFNVTESASGLYVGVEYCTDLFREDTVKRMLVHLKELLGSVVKMPEQPVAKLQLLTATEINQLVVQLNEKPSGPSTGDKNIIQLFEEQVISNSQQAALLFDDEKVSYKELDEKSNQLAHYLVSRGVKQEDLVTLCIERGTSMIVGILGILKAGAAYVPVDMDYPAERISYILEDTSAKIVVGSRQTRSRLALQENIEFVELDGQWDTIVNTGSSKPLPSLQPGNLAYIIYTSGSTGKPKGVMIEHSGVVNLALDQARVLGITRESRFLQFANIGFDASCYEIFITLLAGATLVLCRREDLLSADSFQRMVNLHQVEIATLPPSFQQEIKDATGPIQKIISAGEPLNETTARHLQGRGIKVFNAYGPTENTVCATISDQPIMDDNRITIGQTIGQVYSYLLDDNKQLVPFGVKGELCLSGAGLARGYLNLPELTAEKFIPNPFHDDPSSRLYATGDLVRLLPDGNLEYIGRKDDQVKIRGYRVEPGEIETVLQQSGLVKQSAIAIRPDARGEKQLVGYVAVESGFDRLAVINYLKSRLPVYMVPLHWVTMDNLPINSSGKVDRKALPEPGAATKSSTEYVAPRSETEEKLVAIWQELLNVEKIGINDNFFELGGHSLLAMRMVAYIERSLLVTIPIKALFQFTCISDLSKYLEIQSSSQPDENITTYKVFDV